MALPRFRRRGTLKATQRRGGGGMRRATVVGVVLVVMMTPATMATSSPVPEPPTIVGTPGDDVIAARGGDDTILGRGGNDRLCGGAGDDVLRGGPGGDRLLGGAGNDVVAGGRGRDHLDGRRGDDVVHSGRGGGVAGGGGGRDRVLGGSGVDYLVGALGDDVVLGRGGGDVLVGGAGSDEMHGGRGPDFLSYEGFAGHTVDGVAVDLRSGVATAGGDRDTFTSVRHVLGSDGDDVIHGNARGNRLRGALGHDVVFGHRGDDVIGGGHGDDTLVGNRGDDVANGSGGADACAAQVERRCETDVTAPPTTAPDPGRRLLDRSFVSETVSQGGQPRPLVDGIPLEVAFEDRPDDDSVVWRAGCNTMGAPVVVEVERLAVGTIVSTGMGCAPEQEAQDDWLTDFFRADPAWRLAGDRLVLEAGDTVIELREQDTG